MIKKINTNFDQYLTHEIENEEEVQEYLEDILPAIGYIVMYFNSLERFLDSLTCNIFSTRSDAIGLITIHKLNYSNKVNLFKRLSDGLHEALEYEIKGYTDLIRNLNECGRLRNMAVHADWENTIDDGYTFVNLKISKGAMQQEYAQFTPKSLTKIIDLILRTHGDLDDYWELRNEALR